jgi:hypothetical protein
VLANRVPGRSTAQHRRLSPSNSTVSCVHTAGDGCPWDNVGWSTSCTRHRTACRGAALPWGWVRCLSGLHQQDANPQHKTPSLKNSADNLVPACTQPTHKLMAFSR